MDTETAWPVKQRELVKWVIDSRVWNDFEMRDDDIVIATWAKSGTTWMQQIVGQLVFGGEADLYGVTRSPWPDFRMRSDSVEQAVAQTHRRYLKTHLPIESLVYSPRAKYIYVGRDGRDCYWSWHNHHSNFTQDMLDRINALYPDDPPVGYPNPDIRLAFRDWLDRDAYPHWPFWSHVQGWFDARHLPNLKLVHFANLKADLRGEIEKIAAYLEIEVDPATWPAILEHCSFDYMKRLAARDERAKQVFKGGGATFINKGTNGRWRDVLTPADNEKYQAEVARNLTPEAAAWLETGRLPEHKHGEARKEPLGTGLQAATRPKRSAAISSNDPAPQTAAGRNTQ
jgi:aryl sulfotransferase